MKIIAFSVAKTIVYEYLYYIIINKNKKNGKIKICIWI